MANRPAPALGLREGDRGELSRLVRSSSGRAGLAQRARIVLLAADGVSNTTIAEQLGVSRPTVISWRERYQRAGIAGLTDAHRSGRPRSIDHAAIVSATLKPPPKRLGVTHWSTRLLARELRISDATASRAFSITLTSLREARREFKRERPTGAVAGVSGDGDVDQVDEDTTLVVGSWRFVGMGWLTNGDAALAADTAARARERRLVKAADRRAVA